MGLVVAEMENQEEERDYWQVSNGTVRRSERPWETKPCFINFRSVSLSAPETAALCEPRWWGRGRCGWGCRCGFIKGDSL